MNFVSRKGQKLADGTAADDAAAFHQIADAIAAFTATAHTAASVYGVAGSSSAALGDIASTPNTTLVRGATTISWTQITGTIIAANTVANSNLAQAAANTILGNNTGAPATRADLTVSQIKAMLALGSGDISGLAAIATSGSASDLITGTVPAARLPAPTVVNLAALASLNATSLGTGSEYYVITVRSRFYLDKVNSRSTIAGEVLAALGGGWWVREQVADPSWGTVPFWSISWATGDDEAVGGGATQVDADAAPLKSFDELSRRLPEDVVIPEVRIHILDSIPESEVPRAILSKIRLRNIDSIIRVIGKKTSVAVGGGFTGVVTGYTPATPASNGEATMTIASLPTTGSWSGFVGKMIQNVAGTKTSFVLRDEGSRTARIGQPDSANPLGVDAAAMTGGTVNFAINDTVVIYDLPEIPVYPLPGTIGDYQDNIIVGDLRLRRASEGANIVLDSSAPNVIHCRLTDPVIKGGVATSKFIGCLFDAGSIGVGFWAGAQGVHLHYAKFINTCVLMNNSTLSLANSCDVEGGNGVFATFAMQNNFCQIQAAACACGVFRSNVQFIDGNHGSIFSNLGSVSPIYGSGNSVAILTQPTGTTWKIYRAGFTAITSAAHPFIIGGIGRDISNMTPHIIDLSTMTALLDTT